MKHSRISSILTKKAIGKKVKIHGWVYRHRSSNKFCFIVLRDSSNIIQCTIKRDTVPQKIFDAATSLYIESSAEITGTVKEDARAPTGFEIEVTDVNIISQGTPFPITKDQSPEFLLDIRHLWLRSRKLTEMMKVKAVLMEEARNYLNKIGFREIQTPLITGNQCEGGSTLFNVKYFNQPAFLSQSGQLYNEALIFALEKVYSFAPSFRAEKSRTNRHIAEYWHLEPEAAFVTHEENIKIQEGLMSHTVKMVVERCPEQLNFFNRNPEDILFTKFDRITYAEAESILKKKKSGHKPSDDFGTADELALTEGRKAPLIVEKWPSSIKPFYMKEDPKNPKTVLCNDVLAPDGFGELIGGSERETDLKTIEKKLLAEGESLEDYSWYLDLRRYGSVPHSGFGMGIERLLRWILNLDHIRDTVPFPRVMNRLKP